MKTASYPFASPTADVVFITADDVEFRLHKGILSIASPFFNDMFSLTQPPTPHGTESADSHIPVAESSEVFDTLMRLVYPVSEPPLTDHTLVERILEVALKYQLEKATDALRSALRLLIAQYPLAIFASACRLRLQEEAHMAAAEWKKRATWNADPFVSVFSATFAGACYGDEVAKLSAGTYFRLLHFLRTNPDPAVNFIDPENMDVPSSLVHHEDSPVVDTGLMLGSWHDTDVVLRSRDGVEIHTHRLILRLASAGKLLSTPISASNNKAVYEVDVNADTLRALVRLCYPFVPVVTWCTTFRQVHELVQAAKTYDIKGVLNIIKTYYINNILPGDPLLVYFAAVAWKWKDVAYMAVVRFFKMLTEEHVDIETYYDPAMEYTTADQYMALLERVHLFRAYVLQLLTQRSRCPRGWKQLMDHCGFDVLASIATELHREPSTEGAVQAFFNGCSHCGAYREWENSATGWFGRVTPKCSCRDCQSPRDRGLFVSCKCGLFESECRKQLDDKGNMQACVRETLVLKVLLEKPLCDM